MATTVVRILGRVDACVALVERGALGAGVLGMTLVAIANVIMRNVFDRSLVYAGEINMALIVMVTFLGVGYAARQGRHIRMTALYDQLPRRARKLLMIVMTLATAALLFLLAWHAARYALNISRIGPVTPALRIPLALIYAFAPIGLALGAVQYLLAAARNVVEHDVYVSFVHTDEYEESAVAASDRAQRI